MKSDSVLKTKVILLAAVVLALTLAGCCRRCCSPSVEVGILEVGEKNHYAPAKLGIMTWSNIMLFPRNPTVTVTGNQLKPLWPYLFRTHVTNYSDVEVRGVTVAFYWASFGLFDRGTPIGAVGVDLPANSSLWVRGPWSFTLREDNLSHLCIAARIFHPCDTDLDNNWCFRNLRILGWPVRLTYLQVPFVVDTRETEGRLAFRVEAPEGIRARIAAGMRPEGAVEALEAEIKAVQEVSVKREVPQDFSLVLENAGRELRVGDTFEVTVVGEQGDREVSRFVIRCEVQE